MRGYGMKALCFLVCIFLVVSGCKPWAKEKRVDFSRMYARGRVDNLTSEELALEKTLEEAAAIEAAVDYARDMFDVAFIIAEEHQDLGFTVFFKGDELVVERGLDTSKEPTLVIPLSDEGIMNAKYFFEDGTVDTREEFLIVNALFKPAWEASYRIPEVQGKWIRKYMDLDGLMHVRLLNENNYTFRGRVVNNALSVVRASNQWLVFQGLEGTPDLQMALTAKDAIAMYKLVMRDLKAAGSKSEKTEIINRYKAIRDRCIVTE